MIRVKAEAYTKSYVWAFKLFFMNYLYRSGFILAIVETKAELGTIVKGKAILKANFKVETRKLDDKKLFLLVAIFETILASLLLQSVENFDTNCNKNKNLKQFCNIKLAPLI